MPSLSLSLLLLAAPGGGRTAALGPVPVDEVSVDDPFWSPKLAVWQETTLRDTFAKLEADGALRNFDCVRDGEAGEHGGPPWYDGLLYETMRAAADFLRCQPDPALEAQLDGYIERIAAAAAKDEGGYINTYTQMVCPDHRYGMNGGDDNWQHDLYNIGALTEAAVHYTRATGKTRLLTVAARLLNTMCEIMGPAPRANVVPGHSIAEEAVVALYVLFRDEPRLKQEMPFPVDETRYLALVEFWIENRGRTEGRKAFGAYAQDHTPVLEQATVEGHAVRATLLYAGMAAVAAETGRGDYRAACERLWENMVERRMYITGGLGAIAHYEGFGPDYLLPNDGYLETCAAVGAGFFHHRMNLLTGEGRYVDELERVLYNGILGGTSLEGDAYFYENPLEGGRERRRWPWHPCPCCPPMFLKAVAALPGYIYAVGEDRLVVNLYAGSRAQVDLAGTRVRVRQTTRYPWEGGVRLEIAPEAPAEFGLSLRIPGWSRGATIAVNGAAVPAPVEDGYATLRRTWQAGDVVELTLPMAPTRIVAHPAVEAARGRVALLRGPVVYCFEGLDNGGEARNLVLPPDSPLTAEYHADLLGGVTVLRAEGEALHATDRGAGLYLPAEERGTGARRTLTAVPYYANANRAASPMVVWIPETATEAAEALAPSLATSATPSGSQRNAGETVWALNDDLLPRGSADRQIPRFTWNPDTGTPEWAEYAFPAPTTVRAVEVYWWDETVAGGGNRVPASWRLLYREGGEWKPVAAESYGTEAHTFNRVEFPAVTTDALRLEAQLQPERGGGILEWRVR